MTFSCRNDLDSQGTSSFKVFIKAVLLTAAFNLLHAQAQATSDPLHDF